MALTVTTNLAAINAQRQFKVNNRDFAKAQEKLSSGYAINRAADDAAGLSISEKMRSMIRGLDRGSENIQDGISLVQVADGALNEVTDMLHRMNELAVQAANGTLSDTDRSYIQDEIKQINDEIDRIGRTTTFNSEKIFASPEKLIEHIIVNTTTTTQQKKTTLVTSPSAEKGYMVEAYQTADGKYRPATTLDFTNVNAKNISMLYDKNFSFNCTENCNESFNFTFVNGGGSSASNLTGKVAHYYTIDIAGCTTGSQILQRLYDYVYNNLPSAASQPAYGESMKVSHSNEMRVDGNVLTLYSASSYRAFSTEEQAKAYFANASGKSGKATIADLTSIELVDVTTTDITYIDHEQEWEATAFNFRIQCSGSVPDEEHILIKTLTTRVLGTDQINVSTEKSATDAINIVGDALEQITEQRSNLGAYQNRLEHAMNINLNTSENTQAAESVIRDADMADEMVRYSILNILMEAGTSMMAQANSNNDLVLGLLG